MGYNCRAMMSNSDCGSTREAQCSSLQNQVCGRRMAAEIFANSTVAYGSSCNCVYCTPYAYERNRQIAHKLSNVGDITSGSAFAAVIGKWVFHLFDACVCLNHAIYLMFASNGESVNLLYLWQRVQNVWIGHSESEMKEIHCSNCDAMWWKHPLTV